MDVQEAILTASLLLNLAFMMGIPIVVFARFLFNKTKTWAIGLNGPPVVSLVRPKDDRIIAVKGAKVGDVDIDWNMVKTARDGRAVVLYDQVTAQQIGYAGRCDNDEDELLVRGKDGGLESMGTAWLRITGWFLNQKRMGHNIDDLTGEDGGMWGFLAKATPILALLIIVMLIGLMAMVGGLA